MASGAGADRLLPAAQHPCHHSICLRDARPVSVADTHHMIRFPLRAGPVWHIAVDLAVGSSGSANILGGCIGNICGALCIHHVRLLPMVAGSLLRSVASLPRVFFQWCCSLTQSAASLRYTPEKASHSMKPMLH